MLTFRGLNFKFFRKLNVGRNFEISTGKLAKLAESSVVVKLGETSVMVTAISSKKPNLSAQFLPLTVDYRQKAAAGGRIPTNFLRRELGISDKEILTSRMIDRSIRPLFYPNYFYDTQVVCNLLAVDGINDPDVACINGASAAINLSTIPWFGPVGAVRLALIDGEIVVNPTRREQSLANLNLVLAGTLGNKVVMLEGYGDEIPLHDIMRAIKTGLKEIHGIIKSINQLTQKFGKEKKSCPLESSKLKQSSTSLLVLEQEAALNTKKSDVEIRNDINSYLDTDYKEQLLTILTNHKLDKQQRDVELTNFRTLASDAINSKYPNTESNTVSQCVNAFVKDQFRQMILEDGLRVDGRQLDEIRNIECEVDLYKPLHGSALFTRGQTQVLCTVTFDSLDAAFKSDPISILTGAIKEKNFMLHYEFPPYATNEIGKVGFVGRRELGHGALAERALRAVLPANNDFTIRLTSEVLESNGSSSMATCCGGTLALLDAGVNITNSVSGVAIGLITDYTSNNIHSVNSTANNQSLSNDQSTPTFTKYRVLTDILGIEDYYGDMDFKVASTKKGITSLQADIKLPGIPVSLVQEALEKARLANNKILKIMNCTLAQPTDKKEKDNKPVTEKLIIPLTKRAKFMGYGGYNIKKIQNDTGIQITPFDETTYNLFAPNQTVMNEAKERIRELMDSSEKSGGGPPTPETLFEFGDVLTAKIVEIRDIGLMVLLHPTLQPTLLHNSQLDTRKIKHASVLGYEIGQEILVKYFGRDPVTGNIRLSRKVLTNVTPNVNKSISSKQ